MELISTAVAAAIATVQAKKKRKRPNYWAQVLVVVQILLVVIIKVEEIEGLVLVAAVRWEVAVREALVVCLVTGH